MDSVTEPGVYPTPVWIATQLVPSPEIAVGPDAAAGTDSHARTARFGLRWQVTPLLYSFGIHRRLSPWRVLVVEPLVRQSGSIELFVSPEHFAYGSSFGDGWLFRTGLRSYFGLIERGDYLSVSFGASHAYFDGRSSAAIEAGAYVLFGVVGAQITYAPHAGPTETIATLRLRYF